MDRFAGGEQRAYANAGTLGRVTERTETVAHEPTLTDRANRLLQLSRDLNIRIDALESRISPPKPTPGLGNPEPSPDHIVFALQDAESRMITAIDRLSLLYEAL